MLKAKAKDEDIDSMFTMSEEETEM